jgi:IS30 family transposase
MPKITKEKCDKIWAFYQGNLSYTTTAKELGVDRRTVKRCVERKGAEAPRTEQESAAYRETSTREARAKAFRMFKQGEKLEDIAIALKLDCREAIAYQEEWLLITNRQRILDIYSEIGGEELGKFLVLYHELRDRGTNPEQLLRPSKESKHALSPARASSE